MDDTESKEAVDDNTSAPHLNKPANHSNKSENSNEPPLGESAQPWPYTAIERQIAAASTLGYGSQATQTAARPHERRKKNDRRKINRFGLGSFLVLLWLVAIGLITAFTDFGQALQKKGLDASQVMQKAAVNRAVATAEAISTNAEPESKTQTPTPQSPTNNFAQTKALNAVAENSALAKSDAGAISIPITDVSLRTRPELVEQLVQVYRAQLVANPNDTATLTALDQLQERCLSDIQALVSEGYVSTASRSLEIVSRWFPELTENVRYKYLLARTEYMRREAKDASIVKLEQPAPAAASRVAETGAAEIRAATTPATPKTVAPKPIAPNAVATTSIASSPMPNSSPAVKAAPIATKNTSENISSLKPEIRSVSIVPGSMIDDNFVPRDGGNVFMVEISYRNFERVFEGHAAATLVTLLGEPDDPLVLAEVPIIITADRGTKSFVMETNNVQGYAGGKFQLNFMLNDEFLTSRTLRLSKP